MVAALVYLQLCSWWNLLLSQVRRLRQPQYLLGLLAGLAYLGFFFWRPFTARRPVPAGGVDPTVPGSFLEPGSLELLAAGGLFLLVAFTWLLPSKRAALDFTEAEIAWLFPAPLRRRLLVHYRLLRTQAGLFFSALVMAVVTSAASQGRFMWSMLPGWWVLMSALEMHRQAAGFTRTRLLDRGLPNWGRRVLVLGALVAMGLLVWQRLAPHLAEFANAEPPNLPPWTAVVREVLGGGVVGAVLWPFRALARPLVALPSGASALTWLPAVGILVLLYLWALKSAVGFEDASLDRAERRTRLVEAVRTGNWHLAAEKQSEGHPPFPLPPRGPRLLALTWKNLISAQLLLASPLLVVLGVSLLGGLLAFRFALPEAPFLKFLAAILAGILPMVFLLGPELARFDLRQDLPQADILKTYPLPGWQVVLGELLAPAFVLTFLQWLMIAAAVIALPAMGHRGEWSLGNRVSIAAAAVLLAPALNLTLLLLHNGTALLFPAWVRPTGTAGSAAGIDAMGQRLLLMLVHLAGLLVGLLVPCALGGAAFLLTRLLFAWTIALPLAALVAALTLAGQGALGLKLLGDRFERMDITD
jgi:hypothetical protein